MYNGKAHETQTAIAHEAEWSKESQYFGEDFDVRRCMERVIEARGDVPITQPFFAIHGHVLSYNKLHKRMTELNQLLNLPKGKFGPHSGRIYRATIMHHQGRTKPEIMKRGRWKGKSWELYTRALLYPTNSNAPWVRVGQIDTDISKCPFTFEFTRSSLYYNAPASTVCTKCNKHFATHNHFTTCYYCRTHT